MNGHPVVVAEALPLALAYFNGTPPANQRGPWSFSLSADLSVFSVDSALWNSSATSPPATHGPAIGVIQLVVHYLVVPGPNGTGAVAIGWTVSSWPWVSDSDYLVVEAHFVMSPTNQLLGLFPDQLAHYLRSAVPRDRALHSVRRPDLEPELGEHRRG